jgi:hypothetical protein
VQIIVRVEQFEVVLLQRAREATRILVETERDLAVLLRLPDERKALSFRVRKLLELLFPARSFLLDIPHVPFFGCACARCSHLEL